MHPEVSPPFAAPPWLAEVSLDALPWSRDAFHLDRAAHRLVLRIDETRPRVVTALEAAARFLGDRGVACVGSTTASGICWTLEDDGAIRGVSVLAAAIVRAGDDGFGVLGAWAAAIADRDAIVAVGQTAEAVSASPVREPTSTTPPEIAAPASPFLSIGAPPELEMPPATDPARYDVTLEQWGADPERTEALLRTVLGADTPDALSTHREAGASLVVAADASARDVRRILVAVAVPTGATFGWSPR